MKIEAAIARMAGKGLSIESVDLDTPRADEVLVRIAACGICHTDESVMQGQFSLPVALPMILGHEGSGIVEAVGAQVTGLVPGDHVVLSIDGCGACAKCRNGLLPYCERSMAANFSGARLDGSATARDRNGAMGAAFFGQSSFATHAIARWTNAIKVPSNLPIEMLAPLGCSIQTGTGAVLNILAPESGESIAIFGVGAVGLSAVMAARLVGCDPIIAVDTRPDRLDMAIELGATHAIDARSGNLCSAVRAIAPAGLAKSVDTTGVPDVVMAATEALGANGVLALLGAPAAGTRVSLDMADLLYGKTIKGSIQGDSNPHEFISKLAELHGQGLLPFEKFVRFYPFNEIDTAMRDAAAGSAIKAVVRMPPASGTGTQPSA